MTALAIRPAGCCHESTASIDQAARWLAGQAQPPSPIVPELNRRFGLNVIEAVTAIREAQAIREGRS